MHTIAMGPAWLLSLWLLTCLLPSRCVSTPSKSHTLYVLSLAPYPHSTLSNDTLNPSWDGEASLTPGVRLAVAEINNRTDVLSDFRLELIEADCGCDLTFKAVNSYIDAVFYSGKQVVGIVGLACSDSAMVLADLTTKKALNILQVSIATSPSLNQYPYSPRPISSSFEYVTTYLSLIKLNKWKNIVILYDISRSLFKATYVEFKRQLKTDPSLSDVQIAYESVITDTFIPVEAIVESNARVVFAFLGPVAVKMMCVAAQKKMLYDSYQFIFHDRSLYEFNNDVTVLHNSVTYTCPAMLMMSAVHGNIFMQYHLNRTEQDQSSTAQNVLLISNKTYDTFFNQYYDLYTRLLQEPGHFLHVVSDLAYGPVDYDAVWSLALALNRSVPILNQRGTPLQYYWPGFNNTDAIDTILDQFYDPPLSFAGASGQILFRNSTGDSATVIYIYQILNNSMTLISSATSGVLDTVDHRQVYIPDQFATESTTIPLAGGLAVFILNGIALFLTLMFHIVNVVYQNHEYIKPSSPALNHLAFSGCYLFIISCLLFTVPRTFEQGLLVQGVLCNTFVWSLVLGLAMVFGTVTAKIWRIYRIFVYFNNPGQLLSNYLLILLVIALAIVDTVILLTWTLIDPLLAYRMKLLLSAPDKVLIWYQYQCKHLAVWVALVTLLQSIVIILLIIISIRARKVRSQYNHTKSINILIYILVFLVTLGVGVYGVLIYNLDSNTIRTSLPLGDTLMCLVLVGTVYLFILFLFLPPWLPYFHQRLPLLQKIRRREVRTTPVAHMTSFLTEQN
ncbi:hypothetical protein EMCRGX_G027649 [Ephydatia muelleri]